MTVMCNQCSNPIKGSKYYDVICRSADKHLEDQVDKLQDKERKVDDIARKAQEEKDKKIEAYKAEMKDLDDDELSKILESIRAEIEDLRNPDKEEEKKSKQGLEMTCVDNPKSNRSGSKLENIGLIYNQASTQSHDGDELLQLMGSTD